MKNSLYTRDWESLTEKFRHPNDVTVELGIAAFENIYYEGDIVVGEFGYINTGIGIVRFGEWEQDGSGGEYGSSQCFGFYVERMRIFVPEWEDPEDIWEESWYKTVSILDFEFKIIGNIHENPKIIDEYNE